MQEPFPHLFTLTAPFKQTRHIRCNLNETQNLAR